MEDKRSTIKLIKEAVTSGASLNKACQVLDISDRSYFRWEKNLVTDQRKGAAKHIPRKLTEDEEDEIVQLCCSKKYKDRSINSSSVIVSSPNSSRATS